MRRFPTQLALPLFALAIAAATACLNDGGSATLDAQGAGGIDASQSCQGLQLCAVNGTSCDGDVLVACAPNPQGCIVETGRLDCTTAGRGCVGSAGSAYCDVVCEDECDAAGTSCNQGVVEACADTDSNGCLELATTDCLDAGDMCDASQDPPVCVANGSGESCADAYVVQATPARFSGDDFTADFTADDHELDEGTNCISSPGSGQVNAVFRLDLEAGDVLVVTEHGGIDVVMSIVAAGLESCLDSACLASSDSDETTTGVSYEATAATTVYVVVEPRTPMPGVVDYDIKMQIAYCGDAVLNPGEVCDDGNNDDGDGCAADCSAVEDDYTCFPGLCYPTGSGDVCQSGAGGPAISIGPGSYSFNTGGMADDYDHYSGACGTDRRAQGPDAVFEITVPDGEVLEVVIENESFDAIAFLAESCADLTASCLAYGDNPEEASYENDSGADKSIYFVADGYNPSSAGTFDFTISLRTPACGDGVVEDTEECDDGNTQSGDGCSSDCDREGDDCTNPIVLAGSAIVEHDNEPYHNDYQNYGGACFGVSGAGRDVVYAVTVPQGAVVSAKMAFEDSWTEALTMVSACDDLTTCLAGTIGESTIPWANTDGSAQTIYLIADGQYGSSTGAYELEVILTDAGCGNGVVEPPEECDDGDVVSGDGCSAICEIEGEHCTSPIVLPGPGTYTFNTSEYADTHSGGCGSYGRDVVLAIDVPAESTLTATMAPDGFDAVLSLGDSCDAVDDGVCVEEQDTGGLGTSETLTHTNSSDETRTYYLIADHIYLFGGEFELTVAISS